MLVTTGFGYFTKDGVIVGKYEFPAGEHKIKEGYEFIEVADKAALDEIVIAETQEEIEAKANKAVKIALRSTAKSKLKALGLTEDEIVEMFGNG